MLISLQLVCFYQGYIFVTKRENGSSNRAASYKCGFLGLVPCLFTRPGFESQCFRWRRVWKLSANLWRSPPAPCLPDPQSSRLYLLSARVWWRHSLPKHQSRSPWRNLRVEQPNKGGKAPRFYWGSYQSLHEQVQENRFLARCLP